MSYRHVSLIDLYLHTKYHKNFEDGRTYITKDGRTLKLALLDRLGGVNYSVELT